jgi:hypothetical protein
MTWATYPSSPLPKFDYQGNIAYKTLEVEAESGFEQSRELLRFPKKVFSLAYAYLALSEIDILRKFFLARRGKSAKFWFVDFQSRGWVDEYVGRGGPFDLTTALADDGGTRTNETEASKNSTANDMTLLPAVPAVNDAYYFGGSIKFDKLTIVIGTQGAGTWTIAWEFWDGDSWEAVSGLSDGTNGFKATAGSHDVTYTMPTNWADCEIIDSDGSVSGPNGYYLRARVSAYTSVTTQPKGTSASFNTKTYDLHGKTCTSVVVYVNGVQKTGGGTDYTFVSGGGAALADRITFVSYQTQGHLITADYDAYARIKARFSDDVYQETMPTKDNFNANIGVYEVQW